MEDFSKQSHSFLHAFCVRPAAKFETQSDQEEIVLILRAHPITQLVWLINGLFVFIILVLLNIFFANLLTSSQLLFVNVSTIVFILAYYYFNILLYFFNVGIITNFRIIDVDFNLVIYKEVTEAQLRKVEDVTAKSGGYFASIFNYGSVFIQTAGSEVNIEFINIPRPTDVVKAINNLTEQI